MNVSVDDLLRIIGEQEVMIRLLKAELARKADVKAEP